MRLAALALTAVVAVLLPAGLWAQETPRIVEIAIAGNQNINTDTIQNTLALKAGDDYSDQAVEKDRAAVMSLGYFSAVTLRKEDVAGGVKITFDVTENTKITDVKVLGSDPVPASKILGMMKSKPGQVLNTNTMDQDIGAIQQYYNEEGYVAYVTEDIGIDPRTGVLTVPILVYTVESIEITGIKKTRPYVFLREMKTRPGKVFNVKVLLREDIPRLYNLDILESVKPYQLTPGREIGMVKITLPVVEKKTGQVSLGLGYSSRQRLVGQARLSETNFRGKGQGLNLLYEQGTTQAVGGPSSYEVGFFEPWVDRRHTSLSVSAFNKVVYRFSSGVFGSSTFREGQIYNERHKGGDVTVSRPLGERLRVYLGGRFENVRSDPDLLAASVTSELAKIAQSGDVTTGSLRMVHNTRDFDLDPAAGGYESISVQLGTADCVRYELLPGPLVQAVPLSGSFRKVTFDLRRYFSKGGRKTDLNDKRTTIAVRLLGGTGSGTLPFFEQFFAGGGDSLRGYREDRFWGKSMMLLSMEYRKPIAQSISGVFFVDYGDAWGSPSYFNIAELPQHQSFDGNFGYGIGLRVKTPIGHIRLDYGVGSEGGRTHFSMGQAF